MRMTGQKSNYEHVHAHFCVNMITSPFALISQIIYDLGTFTLNSMLPYQSEIIVKEVILMIGSVGTKIINSSGLAAFAKKRRRELGLTQEQLALGANVSRRFIYDLEHGKPALYFDKVCAVLVILSVDIVLQER